MCESVLVYEELLLLLSLLLLWSMKGRQGKVKDSHRSKKNSLDK